MRKFLNNIWSFAGDNEGAALVEYAVLLGVILAVGLTVIGTTGTNVSTIFSNLNAVMNP
jgi:Flp pilus assembly pilin Flp